MLHVSDMTVRRDLNALERQGTIRRTHGGAALLDPSHIVRDPYILGEQTTKNVREKNLIGIKGKETAKVSFALKKAENAVEVQKVEEVKKKRKGLAALLFSPVGIALITASTAGFVVAVANPSSNGVAKRESSPFK